MRGERERMREKTLALRVSSTAMDPWCVYNMKLFLTVYRVLLHIGRHFWTTLAMSQHE